MLRHSGARLVEIDYRAGGGSARLRVRNDGADPGTGLRTLAGRLEAAGGELTWRREGGGFTVSALLPMDASAEAE